MLGPLTRGRCYHGPCHVPPEWPGEVAGGERPGQGLTAPGFDRNQPAIAQRNGWEGASCREGGAESPLVGGRSGLHGGLTCSMAGRSQGLLSPSQPHPAREVTEFGRRNQLSCEEGGVCPALATLPQRLARGPFRPIGTGGSLGSAGASALPRCQGHGPGARQSGSAVDVGWSRGIRSAWPSRGTCDPSSWVCSSPLPGMAWGSFSPCHPGSAAHVNAVSGTWPGPPSVSSSGERQCLHGQPSWLLCLPSPAGKYTWAREHGAFLGWGSRPMERHCKGSCSGSLTGNLCSPPPLLLKHQE